MTCIIKQTALPLLYGFIGIAVLTYSLSNFRFAFNIGNGISYETNPSMAQIVLHMDWRNGSSIVFDILTGGDWKGQFKQIYWQWHHETLRTDIVVGDGKMKVSNLSVGR